jgi:hypothetical protein
MPTYIAFQDGDKPWHELRPDPAGGYSFDVANDYQFLVVCSDSGGFTTRLRQRTVADGDDFVWCMNHGDPYTTVQVTGHMQQPGFVSMYDFASSTTGPWDFTLDVTRGVHDLGATGAGNIVVRRGIPVTDATTLAPIDAVKDGVPLVSTPLTVGGLLTGDQVASEVDLYTVNDIVSAPTVAGSTAAVPPASVLFDGDQLDLYVTVGDGTHTRTADTWFTGHETTFTLLPPLAGVEFGAQDATSATLAGADEAELDLVVTTPTRTDRQDVTTTSAWRAATGRGVSLALDTMPDRFLTTGWTIDVTKPYVRTAIARMLGDVELTSALSNPVNGATMTPRVAPHMRRF